MKRILGIIALLAMMVSVTSCVEVENGFKGFAYKPYDGGTDTTKVYSEGVHIGFSWFWNDMIIYDCRQKTTSVVETLLDRNTMTVGISASVFYRVMDKKISHLHLDKGRDYEKTYIVPVFEGALKNVIGKYTAQEIVAAKREQVQKEVKKILQEAFKFNYLKCDDIIIRDVELPKKINTAIINKQVQDEKNLLAEKKKLEQENLAAAKIATSKGDYEAAQYDAKTKDILSQPRMLELQRVENERLMWEGFKKHGKSPFGNNNMYGVTPAVIKGLK